MKWFGEPWPSAKEPASICERNSDRVSTPVGSECLYCGEPIDMGDSGVIMPMYRGDQYWTWHPAHKECLMRQILGGPAHILGHCTCCGGTDDPDMGMTYRQAALWVWQHTQEQKEAS